MYPNFSSIKLINSQPRIQKKLGMIFQNVIIYDSSNPELKYFTTKRQMNKETLII